MPIYEYSCSSCQKTFEIHRRIKDHGPASCPVCKLEAKQIFSNISVLVKGKAKQVAFDQMSKSPNAKQYAAMADQVVKKVTKDISKKNKG